MICVELDQSGYVRQSQSSETCEYVLTPADGLLGISGFESEAFSMGIMGVLLMFAIGTAVGLSINALRKMRVP